MENINLANKPFGPGNGEYYKELSDQIYFESGSDKLEPSDQIIIDSISALTKNIPGLIFHIIGCADSIGTQSANLTLGLNRANNVRDYLVKKGIDSMSIEVITKGENTGSSELLENRTVKIIPDYNISLSGQNGFSKKNPIYRTLDNSLLGEELCFIGLYNKACEYNPIGSCDNFTPLRTDDLSIQGYHASEAVDFIDSISEKTNILYISESHLIGQHRMFVTALLKRLWHNGYRELFLEALSDQDKQLAARGYPLVTSGYYIRDPLFGQLVRSALAIGFTLYSFESKNDDSPEFREKVNSIIKR
ncbi:MAG TPA: OmpA family protein, partial [Saprospiraceae bacterium]|nr:OmpA family protein [Saprospiraceae bacterium]